MSGNLRIGIVEDDDHLRADFTRLIDDAGDMTCVAAFPTGEAALEGCGAAKPDVMLVDINLPGISGIEVVRAMRAGGPAPQVVMLTTFDDPTSVFESLKAGANGYLLKRAARAELRVAVRDVASGGAPMTSGIARKVVQYFSRGGPAPEVEPLAGRERQVLIALSQGQQYKEIADTLGITVDAVHQDIRAVYDKLHGSAAITAGRSPRASL